MSFFIIATRALYSIVLGDFLPIYPRIPQGISSQVVPHRGRIFFVLDKFPSNLERVFIPLPNTRGAQIFTLKNVNKQQQN